MSVLNPRENFLTDQLAVKRFRDFVADPAVQAGIQSVLIEFAQTNPSREAMTGANYVLKRLVDFTEVAAPRKNWPVPDFRHPDEVAKEKLNKPATKK